MPYTESAVILKEKKYLDRICTVKAFTIGG